jgi:hypothetical protein
VGHTYGAPDWNQLAMEIEETLQQLSRVRSALQPISTDAPADREGQRQ